MINLISDTVTKPTPEMLPAMMAAQVGDDVFGEDPTIRALEEKVAAIFGKQAAVFCPSGTMTNQIALKVHTRPLDEVICEEESMRINTKWAATRSIGVGINLIKGQYGKITAEQVAAAVKPLYDWLPQSRLVVLEYWQQLGASFYTVAEMAPIRDLCRERGLALHLDGARIFNALVETGDAPQQVSYSTAFPFVFPRFGRACRLLIAGRCGVRSAGATGAQGDGRRYAAGGVPGCGGILDHHVERWRDDHRRAKALGDALAALPMVENIRPIDTNILIFDVKTPHTAASFLSSLAEKGIKGAAFGPQTVRLVTHLDFTEAMLDQALAAIVALK